MKKFEYEVLWGNPLVFAETLNEYGQDGWEVISVVSYSQEKDSRPVIIVYLKREINEQTNQSDTRDQAEGS